MTSMRKFLYSTAAWAIASVTSLLGTFTAQATTVGIVQEPTNLFSSTGAITSLFCQVLNWMFWGLIVLSIIMFLVGGYTYATSGGEPEKVGKANKTLLYAAIAIVVSLLAKALPVMIATIFGAGSSVGGVCP